MSKQLRKTESKKSETSDASAFDLDSDSQPISLASIAQSISLGPHVAQKLIKIQQSLDTLLLDFSGIRSLAAKNADHIAQLQHRTSALSDTINIVRGFNRELLFVTSGFKKDVHDYIGFASSPLSPAISHLSSFGDPMCNSFRMVLEKIGNPLSNHHFQTFLSQFTKWHTYRDRGGSMSLYGYLQNIPRCF